ncbi:MAG: hypothetical protein EOO65_00285 [Methanosarcinales archaeon]|nr:MAG: hypothetical protein EOO65_00285 [Methanosarcinales archaeon]
MHATYFFFISSASVRLREPCSCVCLLGTCVQCVPQVREFCVFLFAPRRHILQVGGTASPSSSSSKWQRTHKSAAIRPPNDSNARMPCVCGGGNMSEHETAGAGVRVVSWNIGLKGLHRTLASVAGGRLATLLDMLHADVLCLQETKHGRRSDLDEEDALCAGCTSFFSAHHAGKQYSGVATIVRDTVPDVV